MTTLYKKVGRRYKPVAEHGHTRPHRADQAAARPLHPPTEGVQWHDRHKRTAQTGASSNALPGAQTAQSVPDVDALAQFIREVDGSHQLGAGVLAERIAEWLKAAPEAK